MGVLERRKRASTVYIRVDYTNKSQLSMGTNDAGLVLGIGYFTRINFAVCEGGKSIGVSMLD